MKRGTYLFLFADLVLTAASIPSAGQMESSQSMHRSFGGKPVDPAPVYTDCRLKRVADLDLGTEPDGEATVPVTVNGFQGRWMIDTGNVRSEVADAVVRRLHMRERPSFTPMVMFGGRPELTETTIDELRLGEMSAHDFPAMISPASLLPTDTIGILSPDVMVNYDVEFDFAAGRFRIFLQDHCPEQVVYWTHENYARVPFRFDGNQSHIVVPILLDGKPLNAMIDTGSGTSTMSLSLAKKVFGFGPGSPKMIASGSHTINSIHGVAVYRYPFQTLTFEGVAVANPQIVIVDDARMVEGTTPLILGVQTLRQLHLYIAYGEQALYLTAAEAR